MLMFLHTVWGVSSEVCSEGASLCTVQRSVTFKMVSYKSFTGAEQEQGRSFQACDSFTAAQ